MGLARMQLPQLDSEVLDVLVVDVCTPGRDGEGEGGLCALPESLEVLVQLGRAGQPGGQAPQEDEVVEVETEQEEVAVEVRVEQEEVGVEVGEEREEVALDVGSPQGLHHCRQHGGKLDKKTIKNLSRFKRRRRTEQNGCCDAGLQDWVSLPPL